MNTASMYLHVTHKHDTCIPMSDCDLIKCTVTVNHVLFATASIQFDGDKLVFNDYIFCKQALSMASYNKDWFASRNIQGNKVHTRKISRKQVKVGLYSIYACSSYIYRVVSELQEYCIFLILFKNLIPLFHCFVSNHENIKLQLPIFCCNFLQFKTI